MLSKNKEPRFLPTPKGGGFRAEVSVIGLGKLGAPLLAVFAAAGFGVTGVDTDREIVESINQRKPPRGVVEPGLADLLADVQLGYHATSVLSEAIRNTDATFIIVPTPTGDDGGFTLEYVEPVAREMGAALADKDTYHLIVLVSTVMPGQTAAVARILEETSGKRCGPDFGLCYSPEFIALGSVIRDLQQPDYVLIGAEDDQAGDSLAVIYGRIHDAPVVRMNWVNAEIAKIAQNAYITMKITFANQLGQLCSAIPGANVDDVTAALGCDRRIGPAYLRAGTAFGGPCFPRDQKALATAAGRAGTSWEMGERVNSLNEGLAYPLYALTHKLANRGEATVGVLGLSYKPGTPCIDESAGVELVHALAYAAQVRTIIYDPLAMDNARAVLGDAVEYAESAEACIAAADVVVLMHPHLSLVPPDEALWEGKTVIDPWRITGPLSSSCKQYVPLGIGPKEDRA